MNKDALINKIAHTTGCSRKEVLDTLRQFGMLSGGPKQSIKGS
jgi:hypothetical protein